MTVCNNQLSHASARPSVLRERVIREFDRYNSDLIKGDLYKHVIDHVEEGDGYDRSYGLSTSRSWGIAAGFAWGRGCFGYTDQEVTAHQPEITSRVVLGAFQAGKDIDVRRFKVLDPRFSYAFGRQQEILAVGGIDPDAVMSVQFLDSRRRVIRSLVRNVECPGEVWDIAGPVDLEATIRAGKTPAGAVRRSLF